MLRRTMVLASRRQESSSAWTSCTMKANATAMVAAPTKRLPTQRSNTPHPNAASARRPEKMRAERRLRSPLHDEAEARGHVLAQQVVDGLLGQERILLGDGDAQAEALLGIERGA